MHYIEQSIYAYTNYIYIYTIMYTYIYIYTYLFYTPTYTHTYRTIAEETAGPRGELRWPLVSRSIAGPRRSPEPKG